ncbi:unnamed protein product [Allacma fusca]|uniref:Uncharacterized protein n=1 Tax=Allacma fusca TaxID=39272 RepID=A0A8J2IZ27_9HEXA|nr:unnamed protein product [Allacma fusca]
MDIAGFQESDKILSKFAECLVGKAVCEGIGAFLESELEKLLILDDCKTEFGSSCSGLYTLISYLQAHKAQLYRAIMVHLLSSMGIQVSKQEQEDANVLLNQMDQVSY